MRCVKIQATLICQQRQISAASYFVSGTGKAERQSVLEYCYATINNLPVLWLAH